MNFVIVCIIDHDCALTVGHGFGVRQPPAVGRPGIICEIPLVVLIHKRGLPVREVEDIKTSCFVAEGDALAVGRPDWIIAVNIAICCDPLFFTLAVCQADIELVLTAAVGEISQVLAVG